MLISCRLGPGVCPKAVAKGFRCIVSNQGVWYLDHLDIPWQDFYNSEPLDGINSTLQQELVLGGEVCMWGETADTSDVQQTIWPRAAAAAGMQEMEIVICNKNVHGNYSLFVMIQCTKKVAASLPCLY